VEQFTGCYIKNEDSLEIFRRGEKTVPLEIYFKVVEVSFDVCGEFIGLYEAQRLLVGSLCLSGQCRQEQG
jgi:hypothetical protein